ncbi:MAG: nucleoside recognition protein [Bacteroidales bacterium]
MTKIANLQHTIKKAACKGLQAGLRTSRWILSMTLGISFLVMILQYFGVIHFFAQWLRPVFVPIGLNGDAALVFLSAVFVNIYAAIAIIDMVGFDIRSITILATMCLCAHNLFIETAIQHKTGSSIWRMITLRIGFAFISAYILHQLLPYSETVANHLIEAPLKNILFIPHLLHWLQNTFILLVKMFCIIVSLTVLQNILAEVGVIRWIAKLLRPLMLVLGLPVKTSFLWFIGQTLGLAYGGAVMIEEKENGKVSQKELDLLNHHLAISHSNIEDLILFGSIGALVPWVLLSRIGFAILVVWIQKFILYLHFIAKTRIGTNAS